ncbi:MAG: hypothetical protein LBP62_01830 [Clostridiales bacterium]|nr:hypothetical protein [Clostridiales bacterium]
MKKVFLPHPLSKTFSNYFYPCLTVVCFPQNYRKFLKKRTAPPLPLPRRGIFTPV